MKYKNLNIYRFILVTILLFKGMSAFPQQGALMSHYMFNGLLLNPGYAGTKDYVCTTLLYRKQWAGLDGAPVTQAASIHGPLKKKKSGLGLYIIRDKIGVTSQTEIFGSYSYHIPLHNAKLSLVKTAGPSLKRPFTSPRKGSGSIQLPFSVLAA